MEDNDVPIFAVVDNLSVQCDMGLKGKFVNGHTFCLSAYKHITSNTKDAPTKYAGKEEINIFHLEPEFIYQDPIMTTFLVEANNVFKTLQKTSKSDHLNISRAYRSTIRACLHQFQEAGDTLEPESIEKLKRENCIAVLYSIECLWHLCEILYIDPKPNALIVPQLLDWVRFYFPTAEKLAAELISLDVHPTDDSYWEALQGTILQGQIEVAKAILQIHPLTGSAAFKTAEQILGAMPVINVNTGFSTQKFRSQWQYWITDTERKISAGILAMEPNLEQIIKLVVGDTETWNDIIKESDHWYEYFPGYLFYTDQTCKQFQLGTLANGWINRWLTSKGHTKSGTLKYLDQIILNLIENDLPRVIYSFQQIGDNKWFATHLFDLLHHCGQLNFQDQQLCDTQELRDSLLYEFGCSLMYRKSHWELGLDYLECCSQEGRNTIEALITRIPLRTEREAIKMVGICRQHGLTNAETEICKIQSKKAFNNQQYGSALDWAIRSNDSLCVTTIADFFLKHYSKTGDLMSSNVIPFIGPKMLISPRLVFLNKYYNFYQLYRQKDFLSAAELLINLLDSNLTPEYFWPSLLIDSIPLLESKDPKILAKETCAILSHLENHLVPIIEKKKKMLEKTPNAALEILKDYRIENIEEIVNLLRLACARNLSRAVIIENSIHC